MKKMFRAIPYFESCPRCGAVYPDYRGVDLLSGNTVFTSGVEYYCENCNKWVRFRKKTAATKVCKKFGIKATIRRNGNEYHAVNVIRARSERDAIDLTMPDAGGYTFYEWIARKLPMVDTNSVNKRPAFVVYAWRR